jgi:ubiquinol-cytochrome c reductase cytochrome c1 subunit
MVRVFAFLIGLAFAGVLAISLFVGVANNIANPAQELASEALHKEPKHLALASDGPFGKFDNRQLQRGFQVYSEVCSACHSMRLVAFRDLEHIGYNEAEIKKIASDWKTQVPSINPDTGEEASRKALPSDTFPAPFPNEVAARAANNNALPPDLSLITKAREGGAAYVYSLLTGYQEQTPAILKAHPDAKTPPGLHYNPYFANLNVAMPPPLVTDGQVTYADGTKATVDQMAKDIAAFLVWTAEPDLARRHAAGLAIVIFLIFATVLGRLAFLQIAASHKGGKVLPVGPLDPENRSHTTRAKKKAGVEG